MVEQKQDDQLEPTYSSSVPIRDVDLKTCRKQWTIERGGEKGSGRFEQIARHDDDDDDFLNQRAIKILQSDFLPGAFYHVNKLFSLR